MSFLPPTIHTTVQKYPLPKTQESAGLRGDESIDLTTIETIEPTVWSVIEKKYPLFATLIQKSGLKTILDDPRADLTIFVPMDIDMREFCPTNLKACLGMGNQIQEMQTLGINLFQARQIVDRLIVPGILSTTMMIQSAITKYRTRDRFNDLLVETNHCVQFEPETYNKPPFGLILNQRARILVPDLRVSNGIIHTVDRFPFNVGCC